MPPKGVDKAKLRDKEKIAVDKTFGMKNKNKSKVVQKYIKAITTNLAGAPKGGKEEAARIEKESKQKEVAKAALMNSLFNMATDKKGRAFDPQAKKAAKQMEEEALAAGKKLNDALRKEIIEGIANTIRLTNPKGIRMSELGGHPIIHALKDKHAETFKNLSMLLFIKANDKTFWVDDGESSNPMIRCQEDVDAEIDPDERPIEEIIEERRAALPPGGTPVTLATFQAWKEKREIERLERVEAESKEISKKSGGKGIVGMSGRDLFTFDASLFVDDDGAASAEEYDERSEAPESEEEQAQQGVGPDSDAESEAAGSAEEDGEGEAGEAAGAGGARSSADAGHGEEEEGEEEEENEAEGEEGQDSRGMAINKDLFLEGGDLPDDLDDLDEDEEAEATKK